MICISPPPLYFIVYHLTYFYPGLSVHHGLCSQTFCLDEIILNINQVGIADESTGRCAAVSLHFQGY